MGARARREGRTAPRRGAVRLRRPRGRCSTPSLCWSRSATRCTCRCRRAGHGLGLGAGARSRSSPDSPTTPARSTDGRSCLTAAGAALRLILVPVMLGLALLFALLLDAQRVRFQRFGRMSIFLPYAVPRSSPRCCGASCTCPRCRRSRDPAGSSGCPCPTCSATNVVLLSVANIGVWGGTGFNMIVMYTALRAVPSEVYEAARIDGASQRQIALRVKIPMIAPGPGADRGLLHDRHAAGVQRAADALPAHQHDLPGPGCR